MSEACVLVVCTANICRSPLAAALLTDRLARSGVPVAVRSAGFGAAGEPAYDAVVRELAQRGIDVSSHSSRAISVEELAAPDLVLTMERAHVRQVCVVDPSAWAKTFTLKEFVRRAGLVGARANDEPLERWIARVGRSRSRHQVMGTSRDDDVTDPVGRRRKVFAQTLRDLDELVDHVVELGWPSEARS